FGVALRYDALERERRARVLAGLVLVEPVVEAPEGHPEGQVVEPGLVAREPPFELRIEEVALLDDLSQTPRRPRLGLRVLRRYGSLAVEACPDLESASGIEVERIRGRRERERDRQEAADPAPRAGCAGAASSGHQARPPQLDVHRASAIVPSGAGCPSPTRGNCACRCGELCL